MKDASTDGQLEARTPRSESAGEVPDLAALAASWLEGVAVMIREKNKAYGNSLGNPIRVFSKGMAPLDTILARMDDKLSRIARGTSAGEDVAKDLAGYIALAVAAGWQP
jgi:hypothetical protein